VTRAFVILIQYHCLTDVPDGRRQSDMATIAIQLLARSAVAISY